MTDPSQLALLDPSLIAGGAGGYEDDESSNDPRRQLLHLMSMRAMMQLGGSGGGGGEGTDENAGGTGAGPAADTAGGGNDPTAVGRLRRSPDVSGQQQLDDIQKFNIMPAGFDTGTGLPTEYPATASKTAAAGRLRKAEGTLSPPANWKQALVQGALTAAPALLGLGHGPYAAAGAARGALEGAQTAYGRKLGEREYAAGQYQFEAGREERERDQAIRERVALAQIEANKAYRSLMASIANRRADISEGRLGVAENNSQVGARAKGMMLVKGPDGTTSVQNLDPDQLTVIQQAKLGVDQATEELKKAQTLAIPEQIEIAKRKVDIQNQMLQKALASLAIQRESLDFRETGPTQPSRSMAQMSRVTEPHVKQIDDLIAEADKRGYIGPVAGRIYGQFLAGSIGSTGDREADQLLGKILEQQSLFSGALSRTHMGGRPAERIWAKFQDDLRMGQAADVLHSRLQEMDSYLVGYSGMDQWTPPNRQFNGSTATPADVPPGFQGDISQLPQIETPVTSGATDHPQIGGGPSGIQKLKKGTAPQTKQYQGHTYERRADGWHIQGAQ